METREYRNMDKSAWGAGPWQSEPDKVQWPDVATGLPCLAVRNGAGNWCGYVGVPPGHALHGRDYGSIDDVVVHGGLTFSDACSPHDTEASGICHVPGVGEPDSVWWFGFDCGHSGDLSPVLASDPRVREFGLLRDGTYRTLPYVQDQCAALAQQIAGARA
jgi:hypothetical protein